MEGVLQNGDGVGEVAGDLAAYAAARDLLGLQPVHLHDLDVDVDLPDVVDDDCDLVPAVHQDLGQLNKESGLPAPQETCDLRDLHHWFTSVIWNRVRSMNRLAERCGSIRSSRYKKIERFGIFKMIASSVEHDPVYQTLATKDLSALWT